MKTTPKSAQPEVLKVRRLHRRDLNRAWEFLKLVFRGVNKNTVEYQRPRTKARFDEVYDTEGVEQLVFEIGAAIVGYAECSYTTGGSDSWMNPRYFDKRGMRPLFVDELASHQEYQGRGVGSFMLDQLQHIARARGCTHLVLEVAQNNKHALTWYHKRNFYRLDAAIFLAQKLPTEPELLPSRVLPPVVAKQKPAPRGKAAPAPKKALPTTHLVAKRVEEPKKSDAGAAKKPARRRKSAASAARKPAARKPTARKPTAAKAK